MNIYEFAIKMELDGEKFYLEQAEINKDNHLATVFKFLAKDERKHANIIESKLNNTPYELTEDEALAAYNNIFTNSEDFKQKIQTTPAQIDAYRLALEKEKESIDLYEKLEKETTDKEEKELLEYLIKMEKNHYKIFSDIVDHLRHAEEWVEDAEFGNRDTY